MFLYGSNGSPELIGNEIARDFFSFAILHLTSTMFLTIDSKKEKNGGIFHRILDPMGKSALLDEIDKIFNSSVGQTTLKEFINIRRNRLATHRSLSIKELPKANLDVTFDPESLNQFFRAIQNLIPAVSKLDDELSKFEN